MASSGKTVANDRFKFQGEHLQYNLTSGTFRRLQNVRHRPRAGRIRSGRLHASQVDHLLSAAQNVLIYERFEKLNMRGTIREKRNCK